MRRLTPPRRASSSKLLSFKTSTRILRKSAMLTLLHTGFGALFLFLTLYDEELLRRILRRSQWGFVATTTLLLVLLLALWALDTGERCQDRYLELGLVKLHVPRLSILD